MPFSVNFLKGLNSDHYGMKYVVKLIICLNCSKAFFL